MRLAIFDDFRLGLVDLDDEVVADLTSVIGRSPAMEPLGVGWWVQMCRDFDRLQPHLVAAARVADRHPLAEVRLRAPVLNPTKIIAAAMNFDVHIDEMRDLVLPRVAGRVDPALLEFDVFLKSPSSVIESGGEVIIPVVALEQDREVHHEGELALVVGRGGADIPEAKALEHVLGYTVALDMTLRGNGDRSRRKSYDTFTPIGPYITTADEIDDPHALEIQVTVNGVTRQLANTRDMLVDIAGIVAYASSIMRLEPGDVILTGAPPGVGPVRAGDRVAASITGLGTLCVRVSAPEAHHRTGRQG